MKVSTFIFIMRKELTYDLILQEISDYEIFNYYVGKYTVNGLMHSPLRSDKNPSFSIRRNRRGGLSFVDYADDSCRGNIITFVMRKFGLNYNDALEKVDKDLNLGIRYPKKTGYVLPKAVIPDELPTKKEITIIPKPFSKEDLQYWSEYGITLEDLKAEKIYSVDKYFVNGEERYRGKDELCFSYVFEEGKKIYFPLRPKGEKWRSSIPNTLVDYGKLGDKYDRIVICKSKKDKMVLQKLVRNVVSVQNESLIAFTPEFLETLSKYKRVIICYDNDSSGVKNANLIKEKFGFELLFVPLEEEVTDPSDYYKKHGREALIKYLRKNIK